jgi:hypothetical protein
MSTSLYPGRRVMWLPLDHAYRPPGKDHRCCCPAMVAALDFRCDQHTDPFDCPDGLIVYHEPFDEFGIAVHDGGTSYVLIQHCPWCGAKLPDSQRERWFDALEAIGITSTEAAEVPPEFLTASWRTTSRLP